MFGKNSKLKPDYSDGKILKVNNIFRTLQGEGPLAGYPSIFIRMSGCNLACYFCDTEFDAYQELSLKEIYSKILELSQGFFLNKLPLIVITGGEPLRQNISPLCKKLLTLGYPIQLETNGTLMAPDLPEEVRVVCSPKPVKGRYYPIKPEILTRSLAVKFLISAFDPDYQTCPDLGQGLTIPTYLQPIDLYDPEKNAANLAFTMDLAMKKGLVLSLQNHKILAID
jgi:organic radical activating enzyme